MANPNTLPSYHYQDIQIPDASLQSQLRQYWSTGQYSEALSLLSNKQNKTAEVKYQSKLGILSVSYECDYFDKNLNLLLRQSSNTGHPYFAMQREAISNNKAKYYCKDPCANTFDALTFSIEWIPIND